MANDGKVVIGIEADDSGFEETISDVEKEAKDAAGGLDDLGDAAEGAGDGFDIADIAAGNLVANGITKLISGVVETVKAFVALAEETREYREDMAKLKTAFKDAGKSTEAAQKSYDSFYKLLGESDRTVEAVNHLAELTKNEEELAQWSTIAAGVMAKFGDSLPIEGLTEAANETAKVGAVTGGLADALNWAGISEDEFNAKLEKCNSEQERAALITSTLNGIYSDAAAEYNELTASTQAARQAQNEMEQAQAALGAAIEPVTTAWTQMKANALSWLATGIVPVIEKTIEATKTHYGLTESQNATITKAREEAAAFREVAAAAAEATTAQLADVDYATNELIPQLQAIVDTNGKVIEGYEARAQYILGQLSEAYGVEISKISEVIGKNGELTESIQKTINAKKAQILLEGHEEAYAEAVRNISTAEAARLDGLIALSNQEENYKDALQKVQDAQAEYSENFYKMTTFERENAEAKMRVLNRNAAEEQQILARLQEEHAESEADYQKYYGVISAYDTANTLLLEGNTDKAIEYLNTLNAGYKNSASAMKASSEEKIKAAEDEVIRTEIALRLLESDYENNQKNMTAAQKKEAAARIKQAKTEADDAKEKFKTVGGNITEGIAEGAEGKKWTLNSAMERVVNGAIAAAKKAGIIKSPSRKARDEVGKPLGSGVAVGIEESEDEVVAAAGKLIETATNHMEEEAKKQIPAAPVEAVSTVFDLMNSAIEKRLKEQTKTVADYNEEQRAEIAEHGKKLADLSKESNAKLSEINKKYAEEKKKQSWNASELEKQRLEERRKVIASYNTSVEAENQRHVTALQRIEDSKHSIVTSKMQGLLDLGNTYKDEAAKIWEELENAVADLQAQYDEQLSSRAKSIAESMNLWAEATKNAVTAQDLTDNLKSQISVLETYNTAIAKLEERNVSSVFVNHLKQLGVSSAGEIEAISKMTDSELEGYVKLWEEKYKLAHEAAVEELEPLKAETEAKIQEMTDAAVKKYDELVAKFKTEGEKLATELKEAMQEASLDGYDAIEEQIDTYTQAGLDLMDGVVLGVTNKSPALASAVSAAVARAIEAAKDEAGIASPSKVMKKEVGANLAEGVNVGWSDRVDDIKKQMAGDMQGIIARVQATVGAENAKAGAGLTSRDAGMYDLVRAVGTQTAGINSLAGEYRRGAGSTRPVVLQLNGRELGRAVVDVGGQENVRVGTTLAFGNA